MHTNIRIDKYLSHIAGISRRSIKKLLKDEQISIDNKITTDPGTKINPIVSNVFFEGKLLKKLEPVYYILNKPKGVVSTSRDELGRATVVSLIDTEQVIYPIGRLDKDTHGLILLTNDGVLTHKLIHPRYHIPKVYILTIAGMPTEEQITSLKQGVNLSDGITLPTQVEILKSTDQQSRIQLTLFEGRNQQIRRMCYAVKIELLDLQRIAFGPIKLGKLEEGKYKQLTNHQVKSLKKACENI